MVSRKEEKKKELFCAERFQTAPEHSHLHMEAEKLPTPREVVTVEEKYAHLCAFVIIGAKINQSYHCITI